MLGKHTQTCSPIREEGWIRPGAVPLGEGSEGWRSWEDEEFVTKSW